METAGYVAALFIGISLGLIGGGGSILTVPVLVYMFGIAPVMATSYSLFIVGSTSLVGAFNNYRKGLVRIKMALLFGITSTTTVFLTRRFLIPVIPKTFGRTGNFVITEAVVTMVLFALLMIVAAISMIKSRTMPGNVNKMEGKKINILKLSVYGILIGLATGLLGAGGGFLLIPTLVLLLKLPMKEAIGTSLFIIALNSLIGFTGDIGHFDINWVFLVVITAIAVAGIFIGGFLNKKISADKLKKGFGVFVLLMGIYIIIHEILLNR
jgi:uncharacterized membrane protein YfcA